MRARSHQRMQFSTVIRSTLLFGAVEVQALQGHAVVVAADEAIGDEHVLRVARVDAVVVLHAPAAELHVADRDVPAVARDDGPVRRAAES